MLFKQGLHEQGIVLMEAKKYEEAKALFEKEAEARKCPWKRSIPLYNIACCEAHLGNVDSALAFLSQAINSGYRNVQHMEQDPDLMNLRSLEAFQVLLSEVRGKPEKRCRWKQHVMNQEIKPSSEVSKPTPEPITVSSEVVKPANAEVIKPAEIFNTPTWDVITHDAVEKPFLETPTIPVVNKEEDKPEEKKLEINQALQDSEYHVELTSLYQMGFMNARKNLKILRRTKGNLSEAVVLLLR